MWPECRRFWGRGISFFIHGFWGFWGPRTLAEEGFFDGPRLPRLRGDRCGPGPRSALYSSLNPGGIGLFTVPSYVWSQKFRRGNDLEKEGFARFDKRDGSVVYVPSQILVPSEQIRQIERAGLKLVSHTGLASGSILAKPPKFAVLGPNDSVAELFVVQRA